MTDRISRADAIALLTEIVFDEPPYFDSETLCRLYAEEQINTLPSAEIAETDPIVIRSKTLLPTKDFKEWAKRIREENPNVIVIPCDAEVASAEAKGRVISAEKLKRMKFVAIKGDKTEEAYRTGWNGAIDCVIGEYASAEAVQGEWVKEEEYGDLWVCDQCGFADEYEYNFCPICGAKMTKGGDDTTGESL